MFFVLSLLSIRLSLVLRKGKEDIERVNRLRLESSSITSSNSMPALHTISHTHLEDRVQMKSVENLGPPYADTVGTEKSKTDIMRSQINETDIVNDMVQGKSTVEKETPVKKKLRKQDENLQKLFDSPDCLDETALTLNFLLRRLFCDVFEEQLFRDLLKEKIELKLKEIAVSFVSPPLLLWSMILLAHCSRRSPCRDYRYG